MEKTVGKGIITFGDWTAFNDKVNHLTDEAFLSEANLCEEMGMDFERYDKLIRFSVSYWKESPSQSLFLGLGVNGLKLPELGKPVFEDYLSQTRFLMMLSKAKVIGKYVFFTIRDENGEKVKVKGEYALTYPSDAMRELAEQKVNESLQTIYLYFLYCKKQEEKDDFKQAKKIYRGIRIRDVLSSPMIKEALKEIHEEPYSRERRKREYDCIKKILKEQGIQAICENSLVSFTSSRAIAKYFANNEGIVVEASTKEVEVITSEAHDVRFAEKDFVSNKYEKEYIVRIGEKLSITDVMISDLDYYIAINSPLAVNMFDHDDKSATYVLNGVHIKAHYVWTSNTTSAIRYQKMGAENWGYSSKEFKDKYGFSPVITNKNIKDIQEFQIHIK